MIKGRIIIYGWVVSIICLFVGLAMLEWAIETGAMIALEGMALISSFVVFSILICKNQHEADKALEEFNYWFDKVFNGRD